MYKLVNEPPCVFSGDHMFVCGNGEQLHGRGGRGTEYECPHPHVGQMFEGSPEVMLSSLDKVKLLPKNTLVFPGRCGCGTMLGMQLR